MFAKGELILISCYELGHQPAGLFIPMTFLAQAGYHAEAIDLAVTLFEPATIAQAKFVGISVPMHTALRLGVNVAQQLRTLNPQLHICFYGLYASANASYLLDTVADSVLGGEFEEALVELVKLVDQQQYLHSDITKLVNLAGVSTSTKAALPVMQRLAFLPSDRTVLPPLPAYAQLAYQGTQRLVGYVEASRGCRYHCRHCPIPPIYQGRFFVLPLETVGSDIDQLVAQGATHITFGDPDFLNGPKHALKLVRATHQRYPQLTFDFTTKIEHIIKHQDILLEMGSLGVLFVVSAVESFNNQVLTYLDKGHTRRDIEQAVKITKQAGIALRPSLVAFTPWTTLADYVEMLDIIEKQALIGQVDPIQYTIRLLIPPGSLLLAEHQNASWLGALQPEHFTYQWQHPDPAMDQLHQDITALVTQATKEGEEIAIIFYRIKQLAYQAGGETIPLELLLGAKLAPVPRLTESWFC